MNDKIRDEMERYPETYAVDHLADVTHSLTEDERVGIRDDLCYFVSSIPSHWHPELKLRLLYSVVTKLVRYDYREKDEDNPVRYTYIGCFEGKAVCMGIAEMMTILCKGVGIKAETVIGYGTNNENEKLGGAHAWNIVWLPDQSGSLTPYHFDATWDLEENCRRRGSCFKYYLKDDSYMKAHNHRWLEERYPVCRASAHYNIKEMNEKVVDIACSIFPKMITY